ncbi:MAG: class I mannose-6-phosphate isomerase [Verrucomicrobia bacterium]|nr:class I mannose-6-phosphate isomerase [Verrucomicrobiota bacterium]
MSDCYPIRFEPIYRDYIWGGTRISEKYGRKTQLNRVAESWEVSDRKDGMSVVANGSHKGKTLHELHKTMGENLLGKDRSFPTFPLLVKVIDAREHLSVQVHPNNETAVILEGEPKSEMWYVLDSEPNACVYAGLKGGVSREKFTEALGTKKIPDLLEKIEVHKFDAVYVPGGKVHAIGAGCLLLEVQQNSDSTYRIYDWERKGDDGKPRALHHEKALEAIDWKASEGKLTPKKMSSDLTHTQWMAASTPYFIVQRVEVYSHWRIPSHPDTFQIFFCMQGEATIAAGGVEEILRPGLTYLIPACCPAGEIRGRCEVVWITLDGYR